MSSAVIVFGPTGNVGSKTALYAHGRGAKVVLAMRDPKKTIPDLDSEQEKKGSFERIQADLNDPQSVQAAVTKTGAKAAFVYLTFNRSDHMRETFDALKNAGIEFVVFLSSFTVQGDIRQIPASDHIPYAHAQAEMQLHETMGDGGFVAIRAAWFASNTTRWKPGLEQKDLKIPYCGATFDYLAPEDISRVCASLLIDGRKQLNGATFVNLCGPRLMTQKQAAEILIHQLGLTVLIGEATEEDGIREMVQTLGVLEPHAKYLMSTFKKLSTDSTSFYSADLYPEAVENVRKYGGTEAMQFDKWVQTHKHLFEK